MLIPHYLVALLFFCTHSIAQPGYNIKVELQPYKNSQIYLGYYYGKSKALADSITLDNQASGIFHGDQPLPGGIYFLVSPSKQILFELLIGDDQDFYISADSSQLPEGVHFRQSPENELFRRYSAFAGKSGRAIEQEKERWKTAANNRDSANISNRIKTLTDGLQKFRDSITKVYPQSFLAALFRAMYEPKIPPVSEHPGGRYDSNFVYEYVKEHYWDDIDFADDRLVRTPFFEQKLEKYFRDLVSPHPDSLIKEIDHMLLYARSAKEMYKYLMVHFVQKYINPQFMGQDAVFVHLFEKYINTGKAEFFTPQYQEFTTRRAYSLMANLIGRQAPELQMADTSDRPLPLYSLSAPFTVICFWDPGCSHCKEVVPKVDSIYEKKWVRQGVQIYAVKTEGDKNEWKKLIAQFGLDGWKHVHQLPQVRDKEVEEERPGYKQLYDVYQTPMLYLLDKNKRIIAKKLTYLQIDQVIDAKIQSDKNEQIQ